MKQLMFTIVFLWSGFCFAQDSELRGNLFGTFGVPAVYNDESFLGNGLDLGGGAGFLITRRMEVEFEVDRVAFERTFGGGVRFEGSSLTAGGNVKFYFRDGRVRPYLFGGVATVHFENKNITPEQTFESTDDTFAIQGGAGVRIFIKPNISIRPEFRWTFNDISFVNQLRGSVAVAYHW